MAHHDTDDTAPLEPLLAQMIADAGPITVAEYMALALGHPEFGYYTTRNPIGEKGDFTTAPEISQLFGEMIGVWCADLWQRAGAPSAFHLIELGPGRGTLMADLLRAAKVLPDFPKAAHVRLVETSPVLRALQEELLSPARSTVADMTWHTSIESVPDGPAIVIANEFFDALPVHQYVRCGAGWRERMIGFGEKGFTPELSPFAIDPALIPDMFGNAPEGAIYETSPAGLGLLEKASKRIARDGIVLLVIDYGHEMSGLGETLQAVSAHGYVPPFQRPGAVDLTAHVDFSALAAVAEANGLRASGPVDQRVFLTRLGIDLRAEMLMKTATTEQRQAIETGHERLTAPEGMGTLFKTAAFHADSTPEPAGFR